MLVESGGDNLTAIFSRGLVDRQIFVIDVAGGDKVPRKGGPGVTTADLLVINKTDLARYVDADLGVMDRDAKARRGARPIAFTSLVEPDGARVVADWVCSQLADWRRAHRPPDHDAMIDACTDIECGVDSRGYTVVRRLRCEAPMLVRVVDEPGPMLNLAMVGGAAGPLGGDRLRFRLELGAGAQVAVRSVAAAMAQPGPRGKPSRLDVDIVVGERASLDWRPQPTVSVVGSDHRAVVRLAATVSSNVTMHEGVSLGRHGEPSGRFALRERVTIDGVGVLDHETVFAPGALMGPGGQGSGRSMTTEVIVGRALPEPCVEVTDRCLRATVHLSPLCALTVTRS